MYSREEALLKNGYQKIAGVDEAGRGPLAGPVVAAAVVLPTTITIEGIRDSKKLSKKQRETVFKELLLHADFGVGIVSPKTIDRINILEASKLAMVYAVHDLTGRPDALLIDGKNMRLSLTISQESVIKGDDTSASIAAASIVAKVTRDRMMLRYAEIFPDYDFKQHKGYPTKQHLEKLELLGPSRIHRHSFGPVQKYARRRFQPTAESYTSNRREMQTQNA